MLYSSFPLNATEKIEILLGYMPGEPSPIPLSDFDRSSDVVGAPVVSEKLGRFFYDLQVFVIAPENQISAVSAGRTMVDFQTCNEQRELLLALLSKTFETAYKGEESSWQFQTKDGAILAKCDCTGVDNNPFPMLGLTVVHTETAKEYERRLRAMFR
jgi:hypothetical protein